MDTFATFTQDKKTKIVLADFFTISMDMDVTFKEHGRWKLQEIAVYKVKDGKIVFEQFYYSMPG